MTDDAAEMLAQMHQLFTEAGEGAGNDDGALFVDMDNLAKAGLSWQDFVRGVDPACAVVWRRDIIGASGRHGLPPGAVTRTYLVVGRDAARKDAEWARLTADEFLTSRKQTVCEVVYVDGVEERRKKYCIQGRQGPVVREVEF
ncbi:MAG: hypothetical protein H6907_16605 [Hyphomicrobiales bacterium]|nr:hypothetical protein [Hyphomicrobiales bacterium]MCP5373349.1 hypothetical protein [Hyphomicrobiales bacterium]